MLIAANTMNIFKYFFMLFSLISKSFIELLLFIFLKSRMHPSVSF